MIKRVWLRVVGDKLETCTQDECEAYNRSIGVSEAEIQRVRDVIAKEDADLEANGVLLE